MKTRLDPEPLDGPDAPVAAGSGRPIRVSPAIRPVDDQPVPSPSRRRWWWPWRMRHVVAGIAAVLMALFAWLAVTAPLSKSLRPIAPPSVTLLSVQGNAIARRGAVIDRPVDVAKLPAHVPEAFLAIEDRRFYSHWGIDPRGIARAAWHNLRAGGVREGGSTITQQLAKVAFLEADRTLFRKAQEVLIAFWLEAWLTKQEILSRYLSNVYFGDNVYGLRAASLHYFSKQPERLGIGEAAMLAGLVKAPSRLAPSGNLAGARARQTLVVAAMQQAKFINAATARGVRPARLHLRPVRDVPTGTYFADWVMPAARDRAGDFYTEQSVATTLDSRLQAAAERAVARAGLGGAQVALAAMRPDGRVVAMVGGRRYADSPFNRATQALRQPGSTFKLFVYLAALRAGMTPNDEIEDAPLTIDGWKPANADGRYRGRITLREAFARSSNVAAVRLAERVGRDQVIRAARDLGITSPLKPGPTLALGTSGVTLLELTSAYAAVAAEAYPVAPHGLPEEEKGWLQAFWSGQHHFDRSQSEMLRVLLAATVSAGTARAASLPVRAYGKTGTTQDNRDALFIGFAGDLVTGVWVGNDDNSPLHGVYGGGAPARIWRDFTARALGIAPPPGRPAFKPEDILPDLDLPPINANFTVGDTNIGVDFNQQKGLTITAQPEEPAR
jgi:penicillin-binding protein 1A